jgi:hypothetical protein
MKQTLIALGVSTTQAAKCPFGYSSNKTLAQTKTYVPLDITYPNEYFKCTSGTATL